MRRISRYASPVFTLLVAASAGLLLGQLAIASPERALERPHSIEENRGQLAQDVHYLARAGDSTVEFRADRLVLAAPGLNLQLTPAGGRLGQPRALQPERGLVHYLEGPRNVPTFCRVAYRQVYPGVDLDWHGNLEHRWTVGAGAQPRQIALTFRGSRVGVDPQGNLVMNDLRVPAPRLYQTLFGRQVTVHGRYELRGHDTVGFVVDTYDRKRELVVEVPALASATLPSREGDYIVGSRSVSKVDGLGLSFTTCFPDEVTGVALDAAGHPCVLTRTASGVVSVSQLNADGRGVVYRTELGRGRGLALTLDAAGNVYVTGETSASDFPTRRAFQPALAHSKDAFVAKLDPKGALVYSTYLGGEGDDSGRCVAVDEQGNAYVGGTTGSADFPMTQGALQTRIAVADDGFVVKLSPTGSALTYATYLGGSGSDGVTALTVDETGRAFLVGTTESPDFPTSLGAYLTERPGGQDGFVTCLNPTGSGLMFSTYFGAPARQDRATGVRLADEQVTVSALAGGKATSVVFGLDGQLCD